VADVPLLRPLIDEFGFYDTWNTAMEIAGWPPSWGLSFQQVLQIRSAIETKRGKRT
jgi:hypothetical protein